MSVFQTVQAIATQPKESLAHSFKSMNSNRIVEIMMWLGFNLWSKLILQDKGGVPLNEYFVLMYMFIMAQLLLICAKHLCNALHYKVLFQHKINSLLHIDIFY